MKKYLLKRLLLISLIFISSCSKDDDDNSLPKSEAKEFTSFSFLATNNDALNEDVIAIIDEENKTITAAVPYGTDITALLPTTVVSDEATFTPEGVQDFSNPISYRVTAQDETYVDYTVTLSIIANDAKQFISFSFLAANNDALNEDVLAIIDEENKTITATVPYGTNISALLPTTVVSAGATLTPPEGVQDFSNPISYRVTAQDETYVDYIVTVNIIANDAKQFISFSFLAANNDALNEDVIATIDEENKTITATVPYGTDISALLPTVVVSDEATSTPEVAQDFSNPINYRVIAQDETYVEYTVSVNLLLSDRDVLLIIYNSNPGNTLGWDVNADMSTWNGVTLNGNSVFRLDMGKSGLTNIPAEIGQLTNLTELQLQNNQLTNLPNEIEQLTELTSLRVDRNQLTAFPLEIIHTPNLNSLNLDFNQITNIPPEIGQMTNLNDLFIRGNQLTSIPAEIVGQMINLTGLYLSRNQLTSLPPEIGQLTNLTDLQLFGNQLTNLPNEIGQLTNLIRLMVSYNELTSLPTEIGLLNNLSALILNDNQLTSIPSEMGQLTNLNNVNLDGNQLTSIPSEMGQLTNLTYLALDRNQLTSIPQEVCDLNITNLHLDAGVTCE